MALTGDIERLNIDCKEWQQKLKESEERSRVSMREMQDKCKRSEQVIENLKREKEEALCKSKSLENIKEHLERELREIQEALQKRLEEEAACLEKKASATPAWPGIPSVSQVIDFFSTSSQGLARVKAELAASEKKVDDLKKCMQEQKNTCDASETAHKDMQAQLTAAKDEIAATKAAAAALQTICDAKESEFNEMRAKLTATAEDKGRAKEESLQVHQTRGAEKNNVVNAVGLQLASTYNDPHVGNIAQECELTDIRVELLAQEKLFEAYERDLEASQQTLEKTYQAKMELEQSDDSAFPDTVNRTEQARRSVFFLLLSVSR